MNLFPPLSRAGWLPLRKGALNCLCLNPFWASPTLLPQKTYSSLAFPIVNEGQDGSITFNFEQGINVFLLDHFFYLGSDNGDIAFDITHSYVESVQLKDSFISIDHSVRIRIGNSTHPLSIRYALASYVYEPTFKPTTLDPELENKVGYFEGHPVYFPGGTYPITPTLKHDVTKFPITYYIPSTVPETIFEAIRDGILYWNIVYEEEIVKVETLPSHIDPRDPGNHIVYWMKHDENVSKNLGGIASMTTDPLTGRILGSRVTIPSSIFKWESTQIAHSLTIRNDTTTPNPQPPEVTDNPTTISPNADAVPFPKFRQHSHNQTCLHHSHHKMESFHAKITANAKKLELNPDQIAKTAKKIALDLLRQKAAHEVGHTLSLRHNFACSTQTDITIDNYDDIITTYIQTGKPPEDIKISSCVMDYHDTMVDAIQGANIRLKRPPLQYDKDAIGYLYAKNKQSRPKFTLPFCTDEHAGNYQDCLKFDTFSNPTAWYSYLISRFIKNRPASIISSYKKAVSEIEQMASNGQELDPVKYIQQVPLSPRRDAVGLIIQWENLLNSVSEHARFIQVQNDYRGVSLMNADEYLNQTRDFIRQNIEELGGLSQIIFDHLTPMQSENVQGILPYTSKMEQSFDYLIQSLETPKKGNLILVSDGQQASLNKKQRTIKQQTDKYLNIFEKEVLLRSIQVLKLQKFAIEDDAIAEKLSSFVTRVLFDKSTDNIDSFNGIDFAAPLFEYFGDNPFLGTKVAPQFLTPFIEYLITAPREDLRGEAISLLYNNFYPDNPDHERNMNQIRQNILELHQKAVSDLVFNEEELSRDLYNWIFFEKQRFSSIVGTQGYQLKEDERSESGETIILSPEKTTDGSTDSEADETSDNPEPVESTPNPEIDSDDMAKPETIMAGHL